MHGQEYIQDGICSSNVVVCLFHWEALLGSMSWINAVMWTELWPRLLPMHQTSKDSQTHSITGFHCSGNYPYVCIIVTYSLIFIEIYFKMLEMGKQIRVWSIFFLVKWDKVRRFCKEPFHSARKLYIKLVYS